MSFRIPQRDTELRFVTKFSENWLLRSCQKVTWFTKQKKLGLRGTRFSRHFGQNGPIVPKIPRMLSPVHVYRIRSVSAAFCQTYFRKIDFLAQKVDTI